MPTIDLGRVKGDTGASMRMKGAWTANTAYVNNSQYIDIVTNGGNSYACKTSHTSGTSFSDTNWSVIAEKGAKGDKGDTGAVPTIKAGTATSLDSTASPTVSSTTSGTTTTFNFGIPKGDTSDIEIPTFDDTTGTYTTLDAANTAAESTSNAIKSKVSLFTTLSNMKKSFSAIVQGLKILGTNVGAIKGITSDLNVTETGYAADATALAQLNSDISVLTNGKNVNSNNYDLDNIKNNGFYFVGQYTKNNPVNGSCYLIVCGIGYRLIQFLSEGTMLYARTFYETTWSSWTKI